jgi:hypothetical protein
VVVGRLLRRIGSVLLVEHEAGDRRVVVARLVGEAQAAPRAPAATYSTVTVFARLRGWSTFRPRRRAIR